MPAAVNSFGARIVANAVFSNHDEDTLKSKRNRSLRLITSVPACAGSSASLELAAIHWLPGLKKRKRNLVHKWHLAPGSTRRCSGSRRNVVICWSENKQVLDMDCDVSPYTPDPSLCHWRPEWKNLSKTLGADPRSLSSLPEFQRFLGCLSKSVSWRNTRMCWQGKWADKSHGTLVQPLETIQCSFCAQNFVVLKVGHHARDCNQTFHCSLQLITYYLTAIDFFSYSRCTIFPNFNFMRLRY